MLNCIDNSGAAIVECALVVGQKRHATIGAFSLLTQPLQLDLIPYQPYLTSPSSLLLNKQATG